MKQTAVEWLVEQLIIEMDIRIENTIIGTNLFKEAKEMEKEQTLEFTRNAVRKILDEDRQNPFNLEQYYNTNYKKD
jgi:hypothetical protein